MTKTIGWSPKASAFHFLQWVKFSSDLITFGSDLEIKCIIRFYKHVFAFQIISKHYTDGLV